LAGIARVGMGGIDVLRSDEYVNLPGCLDKVDIPQDQLNTVIHEVLHMVFAIPVTEEAKVAAISGVIQLAQAQVKRIAIPFNSPGAD
jgi:hypothetical protein